MRSVGDILGGLVGSGRVFAPDDHRVAAAALLIGIAAVDGSTAAAETERIERILEQGFGLDGRDARAVRLEAERRGREAFDLGDFTEVLRRALSPEGRERFVALLAEVIAADGALQEFEEAMLARIAGLLGVPEPAPLRRDGA